MRRFVSGRREAAERGAVLILGAVFATVAIVGAALAVDIGRIVQDKRNDQRVADLVALDAVRGLQDTTGTDKRTLVTAIAQNSALRNGFNPSATGNQMTVELGTIANGTTTFVPIPPGNPAADATANAVRVRLTSVVPFFFQAGSRTVAATAIARLTGGPIGTVRVGSTLVSADFDTAPLNQLYATILNRFLNSTLATTGLPPGTLSLSAVSWKGVAASSVTLDQLATALGVGSPSQALAATITYARLLRASADALRASGDPSKVQVATALETIEAQFRAATGMTLRLGDLVSVAGDAGDGSDIADLALNTLDLVRGGAIVGNTTHFLAFDLLTRDSPLLSGIPNLQSVRVRANLIEAPRTAVGPVGIKPDGSYATVARTAQVDLSLSARIGLSLLGVGVTAEVPFYIEGGRALAALTSMTCTDASQPDRVGVRASTTTLGASLVSVADPDMNGTANPPRSPARILDVTVLGIGVTATVTQPPTTSVAGNPGQDLTFDPPYVADGQPKSVSTSQLSLPTLAAGNLTVSVTPISLVLPVGTVTSALLGAINPAVSGLAQNVLTPVAKALGLGMAGADVWAPPVQRCDPPTFEGDPTALSLPMLVG
ncbi:MAG: hypothetical protein C4344_01425 [Acidimicrobiia bacterium]